MKEISVIFFVLLAVTATSAATVTGKCRGFAASGGGDRGAYEAGVIKGLVDNLNPSEVRWDAVSGISAGSLVATSMLTFAKGDEHNMADFMVNISTSLTKADIFQEWTLGILEGLLEKTGLFDTTPLQNFMIKNVFSRKLQDRMLTVSACSLSTGRLVSWNESSPNLLLGAMGSAAIPCVFPAIEDTDRNDKYIDGGTKYGVDAFSPINRCLDAGYAEKDIIMDVVLCSGESLATVDPAFKWTTLPILGRMNDIKAYDLQMQKLNEVIRSFPQVTWRYVVWPSVSFPGTGIDFDPVEMKKMVLQGIADAKTAISKGAYSSRAQFFPERK